MRSFIALASLATAAAASGVSHFKCPPTMEYCPWTKACSCPPGQAFDLDLKVCVGEKLTGAWAKPDVEAFAAADLKLSAFCAISPQKIVQYDPAHEYCQVGLNTIAFCAEADIQVDLKALSVGVEIDVEAKVGVSEHLRNVCAGLAGLYLESVLDAVVLFNTNEYGLATVAADVEVSLSVDVFAKLKAFACRLGLVECRFDCVSYCTKGCKNYIDVPGAIGARITGLVGFATLPDVIVVVDSARSLVGIAVEGLLCIVGQILPGLLTTYHCSCRQA